MESTPLYTALLRHTKVGRSAFHTPGHVGALPHLAELYHLDVTELPDTDSLYEASGAILQAERQAAEVFGAARTLFSAGGCTLCIQTMLRLVTMSGKRTILADRVLHRSAVHTMALLGLTPVWLQRIPNAGAGFSGRIAPQQVAQQLAQNGDIAAVYLTSPDYFGVLADVSGIAQICKQYGVPLLVDNAHGAHLELTQPDLHPLHLGADMTACSAHKTLPVLTGGAFLNLAVDNEQAKSAMALFGSTSPSYPVMASLDLCVDWIRAQGQQAFFGLQDKVAQIRALAVERGIAMPEGETDPVRITLQTASIGVSGQAAAALFQTHLVEPEYADDASVVLIATPFHTEQDFARVTAAITALPQYEPIVLPDALPQQPESVLPVQQAIFAAWEWVPINQSIGRIAADAACPCPPGVPVVMPGEQITEEIACFLKRYRFTTIKVVK